MFSEQNLALIKSHEEKIIFKNKPFFPAIYNILSNKYPYDQKNKCYTNLYQALFSSSLPYRVGVFNNEEINKIFSTEFSLSGYKIIEINFIELRKLAIKYKKEKNNYKAAVCYALLIRFENKLTELPFYFREMAAIYTEANNFFFYPDHLVAEIFTIKEKQYTPVPFFQQARDHTENNNSSLPEALLPQTILSENLAKYLVNIEKEFSKKFDCIFQTCQNVNDVNIHHKILGLSVEDCFDEKILDKKYQFLKKKYQETLSEYTDAKKKLIHENPEFESQIDNQFELIFQKLNTISSQLDSSYYHLKKTYSVIYLNITNPTYIHLLAEKKLLLEELYSQKNTLEKDYKKSKTTERKIKLHRNLLGLENRFRLFRNKVENFKNSINEKACNSILVFDSWNKKKTTPKNSNGSLRENNLLQAKLLEEIIDANIINPILNEINETNESQEIEALLNKFKSLEKNYENGFNAFKAEIEKNIQEYESNVKKRYFFQTKPTQEHLDSIAQLKKVVSSLPAIMREENDIPSIRLAYVINTLEVNLRKINEVHSYPEKFYRENRKLQQNDHNWKEDSWQEFKAGISTYTKSTLAISYQKSLNSMLENQYANGWYFTGFDFRKTFFTSFNPATYAERKKEFRQYIRKSKNLSILENLKNLFFEYSNVYFLKEIRRPYSAQSEEILKFLSQNPAPKKLEVKQKIDSIIYECRKDKNFDENNYFAHLLRFTLDIVDPLVVSAQDAHYSPHACSYFKPRQSSPPRVVPMSLRK